LQPFPKEIKVRMNMGKHLLEALVVKYVNRMA
jgi:hypothetical protein